MGMGASFRTAGVDVPMPWFRLSVPDQRVPKAVVPTERTAATCVDAGQRPFNRHWATMKLDRIYTYFERMVAAALLLGMAAVILLATYSFLRSIGTEAIASADGLDYTAFQLFFDRLLAAIISIELAHSVHQMVSGQRGMAQVKTVIVIGLLAIVRKLILVDIGSTSGLFLLGIAATVLSLGIVFALVQWVESQRSSGEAIATPGVNPEKSEKDP